MLNPKRNRLRFCAAALLWFASPALWALGMGNATVDSYLNQPLSARIELISKPGEDLSGVVARLASAEDFELIGASVDSIPVPLRFTVETAAEPPVIRVSSTLPIKDPIVRLIVEINWPGGRMLREYTLFLDPPTVDSAAPPPVVDQRSASSRATRPEPDAAATDQNAATRPADAQTGFETTTASPARTSQPVSQVAEGGEYGPVQSGDTLWRIASDWSRGSGMNIHQVMMAIQRNNPDGFINGNVNLLKRGAILRMPRRDDIQSLSAAEARSEFIRQSDSFGSASQAPTPAAPAVETPLVDEASVAASATPDVPPAEPASELEIVPPSEDAVDYSAYGSEVSEEEGAASTSVSALQQELARREEELISEQQQNQYLQDRIAELEGQLADAESSAATVDDADMASMEDRLREQREQQAARETPAVVTSPAPEPKAWYSSTLAWVIILAVLAVVVVGWMINRRGRADTLVSELGRGKDDTVRDITDEAEEILEVLKPKTDESVASATVSRSKDGPEPAAAAKEPAAENKAPAAAGKKKQVSRPRQEEASVLDEESADPEVRLDLARAYIAMGDREAARAILGEVREHGNEEQKAEADAMLKEL